MKENISSTLISDLLIEDLFNKKPLCKPSYYKTYKNNSNHLQKWFPNKYIDEITSEQWDDFFEVLREKYSESQLSQYKTVLNSIYKTAVLKGIIPENVIRNIYIGERLIQDKPIFSEKEVEHLLYAGDGYYFEKALIQIIIETGITISELMALTECDYDAVNHRLLISKALVLGDLVTSNKDGSARVVLLNQSAVNAIKNIIELVKDHSDEECELISNSNKVSTVSFKFLAINSKTNKRYISVDSFTVFFKKYCESINIQYLPSSNLRDTAIVQFIRSGSTLEWIVEQVGHINVNKLKLGYHKYIKSVDTVSTLVECDYETKIAANDPSFEQISDKKDKFSFISFLKLLFSWGDKVA